ncbi:DUF3037 domain-containing protein [Aequorivita sp. H23M31]|uniref:DUF3037 domain-containing protein n=1 Tax=Aequorivita ciconiae TaxID=2494375 RepID=A0A410G2K5_9FLAO|nr:DUF3037 domain-containing protein [Aequorivita sp. H23M31]QAA81483.1 DUF3037 domain-containing protein [Aequorivita sp. H23M31]
MPGKHLYEYAVIRLVPRVEREEFLNVGVILFSKGAKYLNCKFFVDNEKLNLFNSELPLDEIEKNLEAFGKICSGSKKGGHVAQWEIPDRFRWLTAQRSSSIQTSRPHNGFSDDLDETLERLFVELVL